MVRWSKGQVAVLKIRIPSTDETIWIEGEIISDTVEGGGYIEIRVRSKKGTQQDLLIHFDAEKDVIKGT